MYVGIKAHYQPSEPVIIAAFQKTGGGLAKYVGQRGRLSFRESDTITDPREMLRDANHTTTGTSPSERTGFYQTCHPCTNATHPRNLEETIDIGKVEHSEQQQRKSTKPLLGWVRSHIFPGTRS